MSDFKAAFLRYMDQNEIKYSDLDEFVVRVSYVGENLKSIPVLVIFDEDGSNLVQFICLEIASFDEDGFNTGLRVCNSLNIQYRWVKFFLDSDREVSVQADAIVYIDTVGAECLELVRKMINIIDQTYPEFIKANGHECIS